MRWSANRIALTGRAALVTSALAIGFPGVAAAASHGVLTNAEYQQLLTAEKRIQSLSAATEVAEFKRAGTICDHVRKVSPLVAAVRKGCLDLIMLGGDYARLNNTATKCGIDPPSVTAILTCLIPAVRRYYDDAEAFYLAEVRVDTIARGRGFSSTCIAAIGGSPSNLRAERQLAAYLKAAVKALEQQNPDALQTLSARVDKDVESVRRAPTSLAVCPRGTAGSGRLHT